MRLSAKRLRELTLYSESYYDAKYEYRHVELPEEMGYRCRDLMEEREWRRLGLDLTPGWIHYAVHKRDRSILLFRRPRNFEQFSEEERLSYLVTTGELLRACRKAISIQSYICNEDTDPSNLALTDKERRVCRYREAKRMRTSTPSSEDTVTSPQCHIKNS